MADITTTMGFDDLQARSAMRDYVRFAKQQGDDIDRKFNIVGDLAKKVIGFKLIKNEMRVAIDAAREYAKENIDVAAGLNKIEAAGRRLKLSVGRDVAGLFAPMAEDISAVIDGLDQARTWVTNLVASGGLVSHAVRFFSGGDGTPEEIDDQRKQAEAQTKRMAEIKAENEEYRKLEMEKASINATDHARAVAEETERHRAAEAELRGKYKEVDIQERLLGMEQQRHDLVLQRLDREERDRNRKLETERKVLEMDTDLAKLKARKSVIDAEGDPRKMLRAQADELFAEYKRDREKIEGDPGLNAVDRQGKLRALTEKYRADETALSDEFEARQKRHTKDARERVGLEQMDADVQTDRLKGLEAEAEVREIILNYEEKVLEIQNDQLLAEADKLDLIAKIRDTEKKVIDATVGKQAREKALEDFGHARSTVLAGGVLGYGGNVDHARSMALGGGGGRQVDEHLRKQVVTQEKIAELVKTVVGLLARPLGALYQ